MRLKRILSLIIPGYRDFLQVSSRFFTLSHARMKSPYAFITLLHSTLGYKNPADYERVANVA